MKITDFIEWLKTQDQEAHVEVVVTEFRHGDYSSSTEFFKPELAEFSDYTKGNKSAYKPYDNKKILTLGNYN